MKADYYRYLAEFKDGEDKMTIANNAAETYKEATETASSGLAPTHPIRLGLALNYSVRLHGLWLRTGASYYSAFGFAGFPL